MAITSTTVSNTQKTQATTQPTQQPNTQQPTQQKQESSSNEQITFDFMSAMKEAMDNMKKLQQDVETMKAATQVQRTQEPHGTPVKSAEENLHALFGGKVNGKQSAETGK